jgi:hypothetical protein
MRDEPDVVGAKILKDVDQDQNARHEDSKQDICPLRDGVNWIKIGKQKQEYEQDDPREKQREDQKIYVHTFHLL